MTMIDRLQNKLLSTDPRILSALESVFNHVPWRKIVNKIPKIRDVMEKELDQVLEGMKSDVKPYGDLMSFDRLPQEGLSRQKILAFMQNIRTREEEKWATGHASGAVYHGDQEHITFLNEVYALNSQTNPLHADIWPSTSKFEAEIIAMAAGMLGVSRPEEAYGCVSLGGTDSILLAMKAYRDFARETKGIDQPEMILPTTAHPAFDKAAQYFSIKIRRIGVDDDSRVKIKSLRKLINPRTIVVVGSAPSFPHGIIDPIEEMSEIARARGVGFHTDACLGGFFLPWVDSHTYDVPKFDFSLPGVTSISADTHKFGFANKGSSVILYRSKQLRQAQYFTSANWPGGLYYSPTFLGSRPGGLIAQCWAAMASMGADGYREAVSKILAVADYIKAEIADIPDLEMVGNPLWVIALRSRKANIYDILELMRQRGWSLNGLHKPACLHICLTLRHTKEGVAEQFVADLREAAETALVNRSDAGEGMAPIYGMASSVPVRGVVDDMLKKYMDLLYEV